MEPVAIAGAAVVGVVVISLVLIGLFSSRDEKFEDHLAAQRAEQEAAITARPSASSSKPTKGKKKLTKSKKKHSDLDINGGESSNGGIRDSKRREEHDYSDETGTKSGRKSEPGDDKPKSILKEQKKKAKKQQGLVREEPPSPTERRAHFADEPVIPVAVVEEVVEAMSEPVVQAANPPEIPAEPKPILVEEITPAIQIPTNVEPPVTKKPKKQKTPNEKSATAGESSVQRLCETIAAAHLSSSEQQDLIDMLLNKQGDANQWKSASKGDLTDLLKKQLQEKELQIMEEQKQALSTANKLKELREEVQQERLKHNNQQTAATNKITAQGKELQAMQARMKATHDGHTTEVKTLQTQLRHFQDMVNSATRENAQLKNASMRASQLNSDKESLTVELNKLQQSHRQLKADLAARMDQLQQVDGCRQMLEQQVNELSSAQTNKEAEKALSKRLSEVNDELKNAEAQNASLSNDLSSANKALAEKETSCKKLQDQLANTESKTVNSEAMKAITAKLTEATDRVSELQKIVTSVEVQLQKSQERQVQKDELIEELEMKLKLAHEAPVQNHEPVGNHVDQNSQEDEPEKSPTVSLEIHNELLKEKDDAIFKLNEELVKREQEITRTKNLVEQEKKKNNELRMKNWKAMEAISTIEQNTQSQITKAVQAAKAEATQEVLNNSSMIQDKDAALAKLQEEFDDKKEEVRKMEEIMEQQKKKNNDLREKNWKAMDALSVAEKSVGEQVKKAVQAVKAENGKNVEDERTSTKNFLSSLHPDVNVDSSLPYESWLAEYKTNVMNVANESKVENQNDELNLQLEQSKQELEQIRAECSHYKNGLEETEAMLRKLENQIEREISSWEGKFQKAEQEVQSANSRISSLEKDLSVAKSAAETNLQKTKSLESEITQAKASESEAKEKISSLEEELSKSTSNVETSEKLARLEKELLESRESEKKSLDAASRLESMEKDLTSARQELAAKEKDMSSTVQQLSEVEGKLLTRESEVKSLREELHRMQQSADDMTKKVATLEESLATLKSELGRSQESLDGLNSSVNGSPEKEKKKKGLKGALGLKLGSSKKDKESKADKDKALEEYQKQVAAFKSEIEELKTQNKKLSVSLQTEMTRSQQIEKDVADAMADGEARAAAQQQTTTL